MKKLLIKSQNYDFSVTNRPTIRVEQHSPQMPVNCRHFSDSASDIYCVIALHSKSKGCGCGIYAETLLVNTPGYSKFILSGDRNHIAKGLL